MMRVTADQRDQAEQALRATGLTMRQSQQALYALRNIGWLPPAPATEYEVVSSNAAAAWATGILTPGDLLRTKGRGRIVFELVEAELVGKWVRGRLLDTRTGRSIGWRYLDDFQVVRAVSS